MLSFTLLIIPFIVTRSGTVNAGTSLGEKIVVDFRELPPNATITSSPAGIDCPGTCSYDFDAGTKVVLKFNAGSGYGISTLDTECKEYVADINYSNYDSVYRGPNCTYAVVSGQWDGYSPVYISPIWVKDTQTTKLTIEGAGTIRASYGNTVKLCTAPGCTLNVPYNKLLKMEAVKTEGVTFVGWHTDTYNYQCASSGTGICYVGKSAIFDTAPALARFSGAPSESSISPASPASDEKETESIDMADPIAKNISINGLDVLADEELIEISGPMVTVSGIATPKQSLQITLFSDPMTANVIADDEGRWSHTFTDVPSGDHRIEIIDPEDQEGSSVLFANIRVIAADGSVMDIDRDYSVSAIALGMSLGGAGLLAGFLLKSRFKPILYTKHLLKHRKSKD